MASTAFGGTYHSRGRVERFYNRTSLNVRAESYYANPFYQPNPHYLPKQIGVGTVEANPYVGGKMGKPPKPLLDIVTPGTYRIKKAEPEAYGPLPIGR
jgi:hypothetical protein